MADILLLEPGYSNKYPPINLMKIAYFHKYILGDYVRFAKGRLPAGLEAKKWDRVYVATLFTFEWQKTKKAIEYAKEIVKEPTQVYTGGILATLMPELIEETFPDVNNVTGLLNRKGTIGLEQEECIDTLTLDYSILEDIENQYTYPAHDAYFMYMTRGCGMKCQFCAVQTLEPNYIPYVSIKENIKKVDQEYGPKKDLLLMDNNVLRSPYFDKIVDEIKEMGFQKGATYRNPRTGKIAKRYVDFNQGLDAYLLTPHKAKRLGELAIRPARIAFDHIEDKAVYEKAIRLCAENGITHMSNYLLYNGDDFTGKGHEYHADTPEDLYDRMAISLDLCEELSNKYGKKINIFSFPMRYIPLSDLARGYVGKRWNPKYLRAVQRMLIPTQGKGVSSRSFFEADFGVNSKQFVEFLAMPEDHLSWRGHFVEKKDESVTERAERKRVWEGNQKYIEEWSRLFNDLGETKDAFIDVIKDNNNTVEQFLTIQNELHKKLFIHYFSIPMLLKALRDCDEESKQFISNYITQEFPIMYERMVNYIRVSRIPFSAIEGAYRLYNESLAKDVISGLGLNEPNVPACIDNLNKVQKKTNIYTFNYNLIKYVYLFVEAKVIGTFELAEIRQALSLLNESYIKKVLVEKIDDFKRVLIQNAQNEPSGIEYVIKFIDSVIKDIEKQLCLFGDENGC